MNHCLEFSQVAVGDQIDVYCRVDADGREVVTEIIDYNKFEEV